MEGANLIRREKGAHDRRNVMVSLTSAGQDAFVRATPIHHSAVRRHFGSKLTDDEAEHISIGLSKITENPDSSGDAGEQHDLDQAITFGESVLSLTSESVLVSDAVSIRDALEPLIMLDAARHVTTGQDHKPAVV